MAVPLYLPDYLSTKKWQTRISKLSCSQAGPAEAKRQPSQYYQIYSPYEIIDQNLGWKVFRVPETATTLFSGGIVFPELDNQMQYSLQKSLLTTMLCIENTYRSLAELNAKKGINTILICDRGAMDPKAYMSEELWYKMLAELGLDEVELRDHRYDAIIHLVTAAKGAESFYTL